MIITNSLRHLARIVTCVAVCSCANDQSGATHLGRATVLTISTPADADALVPPLVSTTQGKQVIDLMFDALAEPTSPLETVGDQHFRPQLAAHWQWAADSLSIAFSIDPRARWHDGAPVQANDVRFSFALYTNPKVASPQASNFVGIDSVSVRDSLTAVVWWNHRHPEQFFQIAYNLAVLPEHLLAKVSPDSLAHSDFASHPIGSGRYRFEQWHRRHDLVLIADSVNYRGAPNASRVLWIVSADPTAASLSVLAGQADLLESVRGDAFAQANKSHSVHTVEYGSLDYAYLMFNSTRTVSGTPRLFSDRTVRIALTQAIDRAAVVANALDSLGSVALGPFTRASPTIDQHMQQIVFDTAATAHALEALGWRRRDADGLRYKGGHALTFEVLVPSSSATRQRIAVLVQAQLRRSGVQMDIAAVEPQVFGSRLEKGDFDAALNMWRTDPSPTTIRQVWGSVHGTDIGANFGRYANASFDAAIDSASTTFDVNKRRAFFQRAYQTIVNDAAAVWLYEPRNFAAVNNRVIPVGMRADAWWASISQWRITDAATR